MSILNIVVPAYNTLNNRPHFNHMCKVSLDSNGCIEAFSIDGVPKHGEIRFMEFEECKDGGIAYKQVDRYNTSTYYAGNSTHFLNSIIEEVYTHWVHYVHNEVREKGEGISKQWLDLFIEKGYIKQETVTITRYI